MHFSYKLSILRIIFLLDAVLSVQQMHLFYWGKFCKSLSTAPVQEYTDIETLQKCALLCMQNKQICRSFSYVDNMCAIFEVLSTNVFSVCGNSPKSPNIEATFFIRYSMNEQVKKMDNVALFSPVVQSAKPDSEVPKQDEWCFTHPEPQTVTDGLIQYDIDVFEGRKCEKYVAAYRSHPWIRVDLEMEFHVAEIVLYNVAGQYESLLHDLDIRVGMIDIADVPESDKSQFVDNKLCIAFEPGIVNAGPSLYECDEDTIGRMVSVQIVAPCESDKCKHQFNKIALSELEVWAYKPKSEINRAFLKPTKMTSQYGKYESHYAVDGYKTISPIENERPVSVSTLGQDPAERPWFQVNLLDAFQIHKVVIYTSDIGHPGIMHDIEVQIGLEDLGGASAVMPLYYSPTRQDCRHFHDRILPYGKTEIICRREMFGQYVSVQITQNCSLTVCKSYRNRIILSELEVIGNIMKSYAEPYNIAFNKETAQSSVVGEFSSSLAVDGNMATSPGEDQVLHCSLTQGVDLYPWWRVSFADEYIVISASLLNRVDDKSALMHDFIIQVGYYDVKEFPANIIFAKNFVCYIFKGILPGGYNSFMCDRSLRGNYLDIQIVMNCVGVNCTSIHSNAISLCEIAVYGTPIPTLSYEKYELAYFSNVTQSSQKNVEGSVNLTTDGLITIIPAERDVPVCSSTVEQPGADGYPWWRIDMYYERIVHELTIYNRAEAGKRIHDFEIRVGMEDIANIPKNVLFYMNELCIELIDYYILPGVNDYLCQKPLFGRYVSIQIVKLCTQEFCPEKNVNILSLCEVFVWGIKTPIGTQRIFKNEALFKSTAQSSTWENAKSNLAVDGVLSSAVWTGAEYKCSQTDITEANSFPWWQVDMVQTVTVHQVEITSAGSEKSKALHDINIRVGDDDITHFPPDYIFIQNIMCISIKNLITPGKKHFRCNYPVTGRFLSIQVVQFCNYKECTHINSTANILSLCEVAVWADFSEQEPERLLNDVAVDKFALQSSVENTASNPIDCFATAFNSSMSSPSGHVCTYTDTEEYPWWVVDLGTVYVVYSVHSESPTLYLQKDYVPRIMITVGNWNVALSASKTKFSSNVICGEVRNKGRRIKMAKTECRSPTKGQFVTLQALPDCVDGICGSARGILILCEVKVYAYKYLPY